MKSYSNVEEALVLWDAVQDDRDVFIPTVPGAKEGDRPKIFIEVTVPDKKDDKKKSFLRVFINKDEADAYRAMNSRITITKTTVFHLLRFMDQHFKKSDMDMQCVLSTLDMDGKFHSLDSLWSNNSISN